MILSTSVVTRKPAIRVTSKPAIETGPRHKLFYPAPPALGKVYVIHWVLTWTDDQRQHCRRTAKRRRALLASNLPRNSRPKLIRPMNGGRSREVSLLQEKPREDSEGGKISHA